MNNRKLREKITELKSLKLAKSDIEAHIEELKVELIAEMKRRKVSSIREGNYTISYREVTRSTVDADKLKSYSPALYDKCLKESSYFRFNLK